MMADNKYKHAIVFIIIKRKERRNKLVVFHCARWRKI